MSRRTFRLRRNGPKTETSLMVGTAALAAVGLGLIAWPTAFVAAAAYAIYAVHGFKRRRRAKQ